jgi:hypothetical protein
MNWKEEKYQLYVQKCGSLVSLSLDTTAVIAFINSRKKSSSYSKYDKRWYWSGM